MHYYQFNIGDYAKDTRHLSNTEDLAYRRLIDLYYDTEQRLTKDIPKLSRLINMRENQDDVATVLEDFFKETEEGYEHSRIEHEIANYHAKADAARSNGKKGGRPKKPKSNPEETESKAKKTQSVNLANPEETESKAKKSESKANHKPLTINQEPLTKNQSKEKVSAKANNELLEIFNYWKDVMKKRNSAILNAKRSKAVKARLKEGYSVEQIKQAIEGCAMTPHNMGQNQNGKKYDDLELICRDGVQVERFANNATQQQPRFGQHVSKTLDALNNMEWDDE